MRAGTKKLKALLEQLRIQFVCEGPCQRSVTTRYSVGLYGMKLCHRCAVKYLTRKDALECV